jgi:uncharacterized protein (DUF736 family)
MNTDTQTSNTQSVKNSRDSERGALWLKKSKAGADFLSGYVLDENKNKINVVVFKNNYKKPGESSPDYRIYLSESPASAAQPLEKNTKNSDVETQELQSDDIPF